jgi:hypothetical protein
VIDYPDGEICRWRYGVDDPLVAAMPHYWRVPTGHAEQWKFRVNLRKMAREDFGVQKLLMKMCSEDILYFFNSVLYLIEPRIGEELSGYIPFNTWAHQDPVFAALDHYYGTRHIIGDKSRAQGASWGEIANLLHKFLFRPYQLLGMGSKNEEAADLPDNPDSLGWKFDFLLFNLPTWMQPPGLHHGGPNRKLSDHTWKNVLNGSTLKAYSATAGIGRSGRFTSFFLDESAFFPQGRDSEAVSNLLNTTNGLVMLSTPNGMNNEHYDRVHSPGPWLSVVLDWRDNPQQSKGKYTTKDGRLQLLDLKDSPPHSYPFILDGRIRSPWYDKKCLENKNNMLLVAQELDREYTGSKGRPFPQEALEAAMELTRPPMETGQLTYWDNEPENIKGHQWVSGEAYKFDLWVPLQDDKLPIGHYCVGCDISAGVGGDRSSYSAMEIFDMRSREQIGEFTAHTMPPEHFAQYVLATCYWLGRGSPSPYLIWEKGGPGVRFTNCIIESAYPNVFYQKGGEEMRRYAKRTDRPGYSTSNTQQTLTPLIAAFCGSSITPRSRALIEECGHYVFNDTGRDCEHPKAKTSRDGGSKGLSHGDRAIAAALTIRAMNERPRRGPIAREESPEVVSNSMAGRLGDRIKRAKDAAREYCKF